MSSHAHGAMIDGLISRAQEALRGFEGWPEERVDALLHAISEALAREAEPLAEASAAETGIGNAQDKVTKIHFATREVMRSLEGKPASGVIRVDEQTGVTEIASPVGVVLGLIPMTNPISTLAFKALIALKGRNAIVFSCHRRAQGAAGRAAELVRAVLDAHGAPADLVQCVQGRSDRSVTQALMAHEGLSLILATGGGGMVKAAYSSGTPAIGVGPGNAPAWVRPDADVAKSAELIVQSKSFDNGIICGSEHHLVVDSTVQHAFCAELARAGAAVLSEAEVGRLGQVLYHAGSMNPALLGQPAASIAEAAGIERDYPIRLLVAPLPLHEIEGPFGGEKLAPVLSLFVSEGDEQGLTICKKILDREGAGHTAIIHTRDDGMIAGFGVYLRASRILVNSPASLGCIGCGNGLTPSLTLGAGTQSGNSTTDNVGYTHLLNIRRIARPVGLAS